MVAIGEKTAANYEKRNVSRETSLWMAYAIKNNADRPRWNSAVRIFRNIHCTLRIFPPYPLNVSVSDVHLFSLLCLNVENRFNEWWWSDLDGGADRPKIRCVFYNREFASLNVYDTNNLNKYIRVYTRFPTRLPVVLAIFIEKFHVAGFYILNRY